jgi:hypothetical protein
MIDAVCLRGHGENPALFFVFLFSGKAQARVQQQIKASLRNFTKMFLSAVPTGLGFATRIYLSAK